MKKPIKYTMCEFDNFAENHYYFQVTNGRKLSSVQHTHEFYEILFPLSGGTTHCTDGKHTRLNVGDCVLLSPKNAHYFHSQDADTNMFCLSFSAEKYRTMKKALGFAPTAAHAFPVRVARYERAIDGLFYAAQEERIIRLNCILADLFQESRSFKDKTIFESAESYPPFLAEALQKLRTPENLERGVPALLQLTGYSRAQLCRLTKQYCGKSPFELIRQIRMEIIKEYLEKSDLSMEIISEKTGYKSLSQFHAAVKEFYGKTPGKIRTELKYH